MTSTASATAITLNLIIAGLGTGLLTFPWGTAGASIVTSLLSMLIVLVLNAWTIMILVRAGERFQEFDLGGLLSHLPGALGPRLETLGNCIIWASQFLVLLGYTIVVVDAFEKLLPDESMFSDRSVLAGIMTTVVLPLCFLDQKHLAFTSTVGILANIYVVALLVYYAVTAKTGVDDSEPPRGQQFCVFGFTDGAITQFTLLMYTIIIQMMVLPMYQELENRTPEKFYSCLVRAFSCLFVIFGVVMVAGYLAFGPNVDSNVINSFPRDSLSSAARLVFPLVIFGCYPIQIKPMVVPFIRARAAAAAAEKGFAAAPLLASEESGLGSDTSPQEQCRLSSSAVVTLVIVSASSFCSLWFSSLGPLNVVNGSIQVFAYIGLIPGMTGLYLCGEASSFRKSALLAMMAFASVASVVGIFKTSNNISQLMTHCDYATLWR